MHVCWMSACWLLVGDNVDHVPYARHQASVSLAQVRRAINSVKVVDMLPKHITLLLCLEHNGVPLRHRGAGKDTSVT